MKIRKAVSDDLGEILNLFRSTIRHVNKHDYTAEQLEVWSTGADDRDRWLKKIEDQYFLVTLSGSNISGFGSITSKGYLDTMFVSKDHQRKGIAKLLLQNLELFAMEKKLDIITSDVSITARPFFEKYRFDVVRKQEVNMKGILIINYKMKKHLNKISFATLKK